MNKLYLNPLLQVPYLSIRDIEENASALFRSYTQAVGKIELPVNIDLIIEKILEMELSVENLNEILPEPLINAADEILGVSYLDSRRIVIDSSLDDKPGRFTFTAAHEVGHWILHRSLIEANTNQLRLLFKDEEIPSVVCRSNAPKNSMEWQADYFAGALLMPKDIFLNNFLKELKELGFESYHELANLKYQARERHLSKIIPNLSQTFGASKEAARVRLEVIGIKFDEQMSLFNQI